MWIRRAANEDDYVALELNEVTEVNSITFEQGEPGAGDNLTLLNSNPQWMEKIGPI